MISSHRRINIYILASLIAAAVLLPVTLLLPLGFDNDVYESMGWTLYAYHGLPYLASWDMNFPGIVFIHALSITLFGASDLGFRLFDYLAHILICGLYFTVLRQWLTARQSFFAVLIYIIYYAGAQWALAGQRDEYAILFILVATLFYFRSQRRVTGGSAFAIGIFSGLAILIRPTYAFFALSFAIVILSLPNRWKTVSWMVFGAAVPIFALLILYSLQPRGLEQLYYSTIRFNLDAYSSIGVERAFFTLGRAVIYIAALVGIIFSIKRRSQVGRTPHSRLLYLFIASAILSPVVMGKYFTYHQEAFVLIMLAFAAIALDAVTSIARSPQLQLTLAMLFIALFFAFYYPKHLAKMYLSSINTSHAIEAVYKQVYDDTLFGLDAKNEVVNYVDGRVPPNSAVEVPTFYPSLRWRMHRPSATQFTSVLPLMPLVSPLPHYMREWQREYIESIGRVRPRYIILSRQHDWWPFAQAFEDSAAHLIPGFDSLLAANYVQDTVIRGYILYRTRT